MCKGKLFILHAKGQFIFTRSTRHASRSKDENRELSKFQLSIESNIFDLYHTFMEVWLEVEMISAPYCVLCAACKYELALITFC